MLNGSITEQLRKPVKPNLNKFIGQFEKVSNQAKELCKQKKPSTKLHDDYRKALKVLGDMQMGLEERGKNVYCPNL